MKNKSKKSSKAEESKVDQVVNQEASQKDSDAKIAESFNQNSQNNSKTLSKEEVEKLQKTIRFQELFHLNLGYIAGLFSSSRVHAKASISHFMTGVVPAIRHNQFKIFFKGLRPIAYVSWAKLNQELSEKYSKGNCLLKVEEWQSGENIWIADFLVPYSKEDQELVIKELKEKIFPNREIKMVTLNQDGSFKAVLKNFEKVQ